MAICTLPFPRFICCQLIKSYRPRDGKNITQAALKAALENSLHMEDALSTQLVNTVKPLLRADGTFDLADVRRHNVLEHDASFTRYDIIQGDNFTFQPAYFVSDSSRNL